MDTVMMSGQATPLYDDTPTPTQQRVSEILDVRRMGPDRFAASSGAPDHSGSIYGGRLLSQALQSAMMTVEVLPASSLQLLKNLLPWYNPGRKRTPAGLFAYLRQFEKPETAAA